MESHEEVKELLSKSGLTKATASQLLGVSETTLAGWSRYSVRPIPGDKLILLKAITAGACLPDRAALYPQLIDHAEKLAATGARPSTPEDALADLALQQQGQITSRCLDAGLVAAFELLAVQPWRLRRQFLASSHLSAPTAIEWDARGPLAGQRILALATPSKGQAFAIQLALQDCVRQRPFAALPLRAEVNPEGLRTLPAEDVAAEAAALLACGLPHSAAGKPAWWMMQMALLALAED
ncbi:MAG TPA: hypothetical protein HPP80_05165 [Rhodospirillaceae bacterium]|nr:hypothetical protein [Rhodospirillaceae bacterium]